MELELQRPTFLRRSFKAIFNATFGTLAVVVALAFLTAGAGGLRQPR